MNVRSATNMRIIDLFLQQTGTYNDQFYRPYVSHLDQQGLNTILTRVDQMGTNSTLNPTVFSGVTSNFIMPSANHNGIIDITNGWNNNRAIFILVVYVEFSVGAPVKYYIQGFTNYLGFTQTGNIDPEMEFYINSITAVNNIPIHTTYGVVNQNKIISSDLLVNDPFNANMGYTNNQYKRLVRPSDVFAGIQVESMYGADNQTFDRRSILSNIPVGSNRINNVPTEYLSKVINSYNSGREMVSFGQSEKDVLSQAKAMCMNDGTNTNPFISAISRHYGLMSTKQFKFKDLMIIDPNVDNITRINWISNNHIGELNAAGQTEYLHGADRVTVTALSLANSIPALMMEFLFSHVIIQATNNTIDGQPELIIISAISITDADMTMYYEAFKNRVIFEIINDFTYNNQVPFMLRVDSNLFGDTRVELSLDNGPLTPFVVPSFSDSLFTNIITPTEENYHGLINDFSNLISSVREITFNKEMNNNFGSISF